MNKYTGFSRMEFTFILVYKLQISDKQMVNNILIKIDKQHLKKIIFR